METETSGNSAFSRFITSPIVRAGESGIARRHEQMELPDDYLIAGSQPGIVHSHLVGICAIRRPGVLDPQATVIQHEAAMLARDCDVVEKDVAGRIPSDGRYSRLEQEREAGARAPFDYKAEAVDTGYMRRGISAQFRVGICRNGNEDNRRFMIDNRAAYRTFSGVIGELLLA